MPEQMPEPWWRGLEGKVVMVTGASAGIGLEFCLDLAMAGCKIIAAARRTERLNSLCEQINRVPSSSSDSSSSSSNLGAVAVELDVSADSKSIEASITKAWDAFGRIDALINNAGVRGNVISSLELTEDEWNCTVRTNLTGTWLVSKYVGKLMRDMKIEGSIINVASIVGLERGQLPGGAAYTASKAAVNYLTRVMALELGVYRIKVNSINPGIFRSEITQGLMEKDWFNAVARKIVPLREHGKVDPALTSLVRYLICDSSQYITGNIYTVDSGSTLPGVPIYSSL